MGRWLVTGASRGLGRAIFEEGLASGHRVMGTVRSPEAAEELRAMSADRALSVQLDVTNSAGLEQIVARTVSELGGLDVLVNNAGGGIVGAFEEYSEQEIRDIFETNFWGAVRMIRTCLPYLRESRGHIVNITSLGGLIGIPGVSAYCAAKFALEGLTESLIGELAPFGIGVTAVTPGAFRTSFSGPSIRKPAGLMTLYDDTAAGICRGWPERLHGNEIGDPKRGAAAIVAAISSDTPPQRLLLGSDAVEAARMKLDRVARQIDLWETTSLSSDHADLSTLTL